MYKRLKYLIQQTTKITIYRYQFYSITQHELLVELSCLYELWKLNDEGTSASHKCCGNCKTAAKDLSMKDALSLVTYHKLKEEFKNLKGVVNTLAKYEQAGKLWNLDYSTKDAINQNKTITSKDIHSVSNQQSKTNSNARHIKSCKFCGKGHKIKHHAKHKTCNNITKKDILPIHVYPLQAFPKVHWSRNCWESHRSSYTQVPDQPYTEVSPPISYMPKAVLEFQIFSPPSRFQQKKKCEKTSFSPQNTIWRKKHCSVIISCIKANLLTLI